MNIKFRIVFASIVACSLAIQLLPAYAAPSDGTPVFALYRGELTLSNPETAIALEVTTEDFTPANGGSLLVGFLLNAADGSTLNPGLIDVIPHDPRQAHGGGPRKPDIADSPASLTLSEVSAGGYDIAIRGEQGTIGSYELQLFLAGDVNGDFQVDQHDLDQISGLSGTRLSDPGYLPWADVDRNGVINNGDQQRARHNLGASTRLRPDVEAANPLDQSLDVGALTLVGVSSSTFNPRSVLLQFVLSGAEFYQSPDEVKLTINGFPIPSGNLTIEPHRIAAATGLYDGRNNISFSAVDTLGRPLYYTTTVWAGSYTLRVNLVDENGLLFTGPAIVEAKLSDDPSITAQASTTSGSVQFQNLPFRTILVQAQTTDNRFGLIGVIGAQGFAQVRLLDFNAPSDIDNNDFSLGTAGWDIGTAPVQIVSHIEGIPGRFSAVMMQPTKREEASEPKMIPPPLQPMSSLIDNDLVLSTADEGEQAISRTFNTDPGTTAVRIRYRFITSEVPGGWFGSRYNDYFRVSLRSQRGGGFAGESNSMNGLGLGAFDYASGATAWREVTLQTNRESDTIQVDVGVANVGDGLFDSQVVIDFVEEVKDQVRPTLAWNNTQGGLDLTYTVENGELQQEARINVFWASGPGYESRIGGPIFTHAVPAGTAAGQYGPVHIPGALLENDPPGVTHLIAASSPTSIGAVADVRVNFGPNANAGVVWARTLDIIKDGLRAAGQPSATITSTARTPADQARAMFQNLVNPANPISVNVANQLALYAPPGDAVINVFVNMTQGMTYQQIIQNQAAIRAAMEQEILNQGPSNVSRHCADPNQINVVDIGASAFNASNAPLFVNAVQSRVSRFIDERNTNGAYHIEVQ